LALPSLTNTVRECLSIIIHDLRNLLQPLLVKRLAVWLSGNALVSINVVTLRRARLVPGWVAVFWRVTSHPGQLSLPIPPWVGEMSISLGHASDNSGLSTYGLNGLWKGDEQPVYASSGVGPALLFTLLVTYHIGLYVNKKLSCC